MYTNVYECGSRLYLLDMLAVGQHLMMLKWQFLAEHHRAVFLDSVENVKPHGGSQQLGPPSQTRVDVWRAYGCVAEVLGWMCSHGVGRVV